MSTHPRTADRAAILREAARAIEVWQHERDDEVNELLGALDTRTEIEHIVVHRAAAHLRRLADEAQPDWQQCPASEFDGYGLQCQKEAGHNLCTFEEPGQADEEQQPTA